MKKCPFNSDNCNNECELYIDPDELNEQVVNRLVSIGVMQKSTGHCSFKNLALASMREIFENTSTKRF